MNSWFLRSSVKGQGHNGQILNLPCECRRGRELYTSFIAILVSRDKYVRGANVIACVCVRIRVGLWCVNKNLNLGHNRQTRSDKKNTPVALSFTWLFQKPTLGELYNYYKHKQWAKPTSSINFCWQIQILNVIEMNFWVR